MKKLIAIVIAALSVSSASASYLYWQVTGNEDFTGISSVPAEDVTYARLTVRDSSGTDVSYSSVVQLDQYASTPTTVSGYNTIDITSLQNGAAYSFYIELGTYASSTFSGKAISNSVSGSYQDNAWTYAALNDAIYSSASLPDSAMAKMIPFHAASYSVPEPTSAILMLFGAAMLCLKRKNRSIA